MKASKEKVKDQSKYRAWVTNHKPTMSLILLPLMDLCLPIKAEDLGGMENQDPIKYKNAKRLGGRGPMSKP